MPSVRPGSTPGRERWTLLWAPVLSALAAGLVLHVAAWLANGAEGIDAWWWASLSAAALAGSLSAGLVVRRTLGARLGALTKHLDERVETRDLLARLPDLGDDDEVGRIAAAFNRLLARMTAQEGEAIDRGRQLESTQRALGLAEQLASKHAELEQRLVERALIFEALRESADSHDLGRVLASLADRLGRAMRMRELVVALAAGEEAGRPRYVARAAWGFAEDVEVVGRTFARPTFGPLRADRGMMLVADLARAPESVRVLDALGDEGSLAVVPIVHRGRELGLLLLTRPPDDPLGEQEARLLEAVADQAALAIHNAQLIHQLEEMATHDALTALPNRRLFAQRLEHTLQRADRFDHPVSVLALDLDHFKQLNDHAGHAAGDAVLVEVAEVLRRSLRAVDTPARVGGEELLVLLTETDSAGAAEVAEKLRASVAALTLEGVASQPLGHLSVSIGIAVREPGEDAAALLARADEALYAAKRTGRDRVSVAPPSRPPPGR